ncbi:hypothetical protein G9A89_020844 [Geosiphon pyriformis]|nr:hypothetical protein G9A89_020844 [Geosiphon pyriformis]
MTTPDTATLEYYQSIYTHCKQRFNIPDGIEIVKKTFYLYIKNHINNYFFGNYNISEIRSNLYNNLYCKKKYPVQSKYSFDSESETKISNKGKQKAKQHSKTIPNTPILTKTTTKHLQTLEQGTKPISTSANLLDYLWENESNYSESLESEETEAEQETEDLENKEEMASTYIAKILEFTEEDSKTSP